MYKRMLGLKILALCTCFMLAICTPGLASERELELDADLDLDKYSHISALPEVIAEPLHLDEEVVVAELLGDTYTREVIREDALFFSSGDEPYTRIINLSCKSENDDMYNAIFYYSDNSMNDAETCMSEAFTSEVMFQFPEQQERFAARDLDFAPIEQARQMVTEQLEALGLNNLSLEHEYALSRDDIIEEIELNRQRYGNESSDGEADAVNAAQDCYIFQYAQSFYGVNLSSYYRSETIDITLRTYLSEGANIVVHVYENGISHISARLTKKEVSSSEPKPIVSAQEALDAARAYYSGRRATIGKVLKSCDLLYYFDDLGDGTCRMYPVWVFYTEEHGQRYEAYGMPDKEFCVVDAYTGEVARVV